MNNCQNGTGVSPDATQTHALVKVLAEHLSTYTRREWFDRALALHLVHEHETTQGWKR